MGFFNQFLQLTLDCFDPKSVHKTDSGKVKDVCHIKRY